MSIKITEEGKTLLEDAILQDKKVVFSQIELIADVEKSPTEMVKRVDVSKVSASDYNTITVQAQIDNDGFLDTYYFNRANVYDDEVLFAYDDGINICIPAETTKVINDLEMMMKIDSAVADLKIIYEGYVLRKDFDDIESKIQKINTTIKDIEANAVTQNDCTDQVSWNSQIVKKEFLTIGNMAFFRATGGFSTSRGSIVLATIPQGYFPETTGNQSSYELMGVFTSAYDKERRNCYVTLNCLSGNVDLQINNNETYSDTRADDNVQMIFYGFWKMNTESQGGTGGSISYREDIEKLRQSIQDSKKEIVKSGREIDSLKEDLGDVSDEIVRDNLIKPENIETGYFSVLNSKLKKETNSSYRRVENIKIPSENEGKLYIRTEGYSLLFFQNSEKQVISNVELSVYPNRVQEKDIPNTSVFISFFWLPSTLTEIGDVFVSVKKSELKNYQYKNFSLPNYDFSENVDNTLSVSGKAADAKAVGDALKKANNQSIYDGKVMLFAGDSICYGANWRPKPDDYSTTGWRKLVQEKYPTAKTYGYGIGGTTIAIRAGRTDSIYERLTKMYSEHSEADYIILQGGVNDCWTSVPLGEITKNYDKKLDTSTFCGAMEQMLKDAILKWKGKKIGFICTYKVHDADTILDNGNIVWDFKSYMDKAKEICDKWSVPYCDLYNDSGLCLKLDDIASAYSDGGTHVNELGYRIVFPKIDSWLKTL